MLRTNIKTVDIDDVVTHARSVIEREKELGNNDNVELLSYALEEIENVIYNPEWSDASVKRTLEEYLTSDPYAWCFIPNLAEIEDYAVENDIWDVRVCFQSPRNESYIVALNF
jgi:hypothetical protein